jgi:hypothetical protein
MRWHRRAAAARGFVRRNWLMIFRAVALGVISAVLVALLM